MGFPDGKIANVVVATAVENDGLDGFGKEEDGCGAIPGFKVSRLVVLMLRETRCSQCLGERFAEVSLRRLMWKLILCYKTK